MVRGSETMMICEKDEGLAQCGEVKYRTREFSFCQMISRLWKPRHYLCMTYVESLLSMEKLRFEGSKTSISSTHLQRYVRCKQMQCLVLQRSGALLTVISRWVCFRATNNHIWSSAYDVTQSFAGRDARAAAPVPWCTCRTSRADPLVSSRTCQTPITW